MFCNFRFELRLCILIFRKTNCFEIHFFFLKSTACGSHKIGIYCFSAKHAALERKIKDWSTQNQDNRIMCQSGVTCLSVDCCFSELAL